MQLTATTLAVSELSEADAGTVVMSDELDCLLLRRDKLSGVVRRDVHE